MRSLKIRESPPIWCSHKWWVTDALVGHLLELRRVVVRACVLTPVSGSAHIRHLRPIEKGIREVGVKKRGASKISSAKPGSSEIRSDKAHVRQVRSMEHSSSEVRLIKGGTLKVQDRQVKLLAWADVFTNFWSA